VVCLGLSGVLPEETPTPTMQRLFQRGPDFGGVVIRRSYEGGGGIFWHGGGGYVAACKRLHHSRAFCILNFVFLDQTGICNRHIWERVWLAL